MSFQLVYKVRVVKCLRRIITVACCVCACAVLCEDAAYAGSEVVPKTKAASPTATLRITTIVVLM